MGGLTVFGDRGGGVSIRLNVDDYEEKVGLL